MKEGVYLLILPGDDFARPVSLKNIESGGGDILASVEGIMLTANLPNGYQLIPLLAVTEQRLAALELAASALKLLSDISGADNSHPLAVIDHMIKESKP